MTGEDYLPSDQAILDFIDGCETPPSVKEVARAFDLPQELRAPLRRKLKSLAERGAIARQAGRRIASPEALPEVTVVIIRKVDRDGSLLAVPAIETDGTPPSIRIFRNDAVAGPRVPVSRCWRGFAGSAAHAMKARSFAFWNRYNAACSAPLFRGAAD